MIDMDVIKHVLDMFLEGDITQQELAEWAYETITGQAEIEDPLVNEILFSLVGLGNLNIALKHYSAVNRLENYLNVLQDQSEETPVQNKNKKLLN